MSYGLNQVQLIGRVGADAEIRSLGNGGKVANFSLATDESFRSKETGEWVDRVEWHRCTTFQPGLVEVLAKHCRKGRPAFVQGKLQTRKWQDREGRDRTTTEVLLVPGGRVSFLDKANGSDSAGADPSDADPSGADTSPPADAPASAEVDAGAHLPS